MLVVKTFLKETEFKGIGLFAGIDLTDGQIIHVTDKNFNKTFSKEEIEYFGPLQKEFCETYMIHLEGGNCVLDLDNARFINHSSEPNLLATTEYIMTTRNIVAGEELLLDYRDFDHECANDLGFEVHE